MARIEKTIAEDLFDRGIEQGELLGGRRFLLRLLKTKFGSVSEELRNWLNQTNDIAALERFGLLIIRVSSEDELRDAWKRLAAPKTRRGKANRKVPAKAKN